MKLFFIFIALLFGIGSYSQESIKIDDVVNNIVMGPQAGNRDLAFGVQNILEEVLQEKGYDLDPNSTKVLKVELLFFDVKSTNMQLAALEADPYGGRYATQSIYDLLPNAVNVSNIGNRHLLSL